MELSNRTLGIACASVILLTVSLRTQSSSFGANNNSAPSAPTQTSSIPDSNFSVVNSVGTVHEPQLNLGTPNQRLIQQNQAGAIVPGVTRTQNDNSTVPTQSTPVPEAQAGQTNSDPQASDATGNWPWDNSGTVSAATSDNDLLDMLLDSMSEDDQTAFRMTWATLNHHDRQAILDSLRVSTNSMQPRLQP
jgi:hypothetical protein